MYVYESRAGEYYTLEEYIYDIDDDEDIYIGEIGHKEDLDDFIKEYEREENDRY